MAAGHLYRVTYRRTSGSGGWWGVMGLAKRHVPNWRIVNGVQGWDGRGDHPGGERTTDPYMTFLVGTREGPSDSDVADALPSRINTFAGRSIGATWRLERVIKVRDLPQESMATFGPQAEGPGPGTPDPPPGDIVWDPSASVGDTRETVDAEAVAEEDLSGGAASEAFHRTSDVPNPDLPPTMKKTEGSSGFVPQASDPPGSAPTVSDDELFGGGASSRPPRMTRTTEEDLEAGEDVFRDPTDTEPTSPQEGSERDLGPLLLAAAAFFVFRGF